MSTRGFPALAVFAFALALQPAWSAEPVESPQQLIKDVVFNELNDHEHHSFFEYVDTKRTGQQTIVKAEVETKGGRVHRLLAENGKPLSPEEQEEESRRLVALIHDPSQQQKLLRDYRGDEDRIARIVGLMPNGFIYHYDGVEGDDIRLKYEPNPSFKPPTYEAKVFHGMAGTVWINAREKRLSRLTGWLVSNVDFGYGLLGRLDKGGTFNMERFEATPGNWKTRVLEVHITGYVILLKSISKDQMEVRSDFHQVSANLTLEQAESLLNQPLAANEIRDPKLKTANPDTSQADVRRTFVALALK
jgi:hypothetical protein